MNHKIIQMASDENGWQYLTDTGYILRDSFGKMKIEHRPLEIDFLLETDRLQDTKSADNIEIDITDVQKGAENDSRVSHW